MLALVHSPLTGPFVWQLAAQELARRGVEVTVAEVAEHPSSVAPFWDQEASSAARTLRAVQGPLVAGNAATTCERGIGGW